MYGAIRSRGFPADLMVEIKTGYYVRPSDILGMKPQADTTLLLLRDGRDGAVHFEVPGISPTQVYEVITEKLTERFKEMQKAMLENRKRMPRIPDHYIGDALDEIEADGGTEPPGLF